MHEYRNNLPRIQAIFIRINPTSPYPTTNIRQHHSKKMIKIYNATLKHLQEATKTLELARLVNQHLEKYPSINNLNENKTIQQHINPITLEKTMEPWKNHEWNPLLNVIIELVGIKKPPQKNA